MNAEKFIKLLKCVVKDAAVEDVVNNLKSPPGRKIKRSECEISEWYKNLSQDELRNVNSVISSAVDEAIFGVLSVIDGVRPIFEMEVKGKLILVYKYKEECVILNDEGGELLHDIYNSES
jgi:hypothetical protein